MWSPVRVIIVLTNYLLGANKHTRRKKTRLLIYPTPTKFSLSLSLSLCCTCSMENQNHENRERKKVEDGALVGFSPVSSPRIFWKSRKRSSTGIHFSFINYYYFFPYYLLKFYIFIFSIGLEFQTHHLIYLPVPLSQYLDKFS